MTYYLPMSQEEYDALEDERRGIRGGYVDNSGICHESYSAACAYYGVETPAQLAAEDAYYDAEDAIAWQDEMEARGGPVPVAPAYQWDADDDLPF